MQATKVEMTGFEPAMTGVVLALRPPGALASGHISWRCYGDSNPDPM